MQLVADVGGTNARLALATEGRLRPETAQRFPGDGYAGFDAVLQVYLDAQGRPPLQAACVAVAGPVGAGRARLTNRGWHFDADAIAAATGAAEVRLINDLTALGHATARIAPRVLRAGSPAMPRNGQSLVVNAGTGFNVCAVAALPGGARACLEAEEGHTDLPATVAARLRQRLGSAAVRFPSVEELFAGRGLSALHAALTAGTAPMRAEEIAAAADRGDAAAIESCGFYADLFGLLLRELALRFMPRDGLWLAGSVARSAAQRLPRLTAAMAEAATLREIATGVPLLLIEDDMAGLEGCLAAITR